MGSLLKGGIDLSVITEFVLVASSLGSLTNFFIGRFRSQAEKFDDNTDKFRTETVAQLQRMAPADSLLHRHVRAAATRIEDLVVMRDVAESLEDAHDIIEIKEFYENYCQRIHFLRSLDVDYVSLVTNFDLCYDFRNELEFELWDYFSDAALMGMLVLEECEGHIRDDDGRLHFESYLVFQSLLELTENFLEEAMSVAQAHDKRREDHVKYVKILHHIFDHYLTQGLDRMGMLAFREGFFGFSARSFSRAKTVSGRILENETNQSLREYYANQNHLFGLYVDLAVAFAWLEKYRAGLLKLRSSLTPADLKSRLRAEVVDFLGRGAEYSIDIIRKRTKNELKAIDVLFKEFYAKPQDIPENLDDVDLDIFKKDIGLPEIHWQPPRIG